MASRDRSDDPTMTGSEFPSTHEPEEIRVSRLGALAAYPQLNSKHLREIENEMTEQTFEEGEYLMKQGEPGNSLMVVQRGRVEIRVTSGDQVHVLKQGGEGHVYGEMSLLTQEPRTADVVALTPVKVLTLPIEAARRLISGNPSLAEVLSHLIARRLGKEFDALAGKEFHGYQIESRLGRGGQSVVYRAKPKHGNETVALKMLSHALVFRPRSRAAFKREADIIESFDHDNIVRTLGRFKAFSTYFIVMEHCDGVSLEEVLAERGRLPVEMVKSLVGQLASALAYAHKRDIVHRDLKPSNVMVNRSGIVKLMDFGLARPSEQAKESLKGAVAGTPRYMSPEQLNQKAVGTPTDIYGLAGIAWELASGDTMFQSKTFSDLRKEQAAWKVPKFKEIVPELDSELLKFIEVGLQKNPSDRRVDLNQIAKWAKPVRYQELMGEDTV